MKTPSSQRYINYGFLGIALLLFGAWAHFFGTGWPPPLAILAGMAIGAGVYFGFQLLFWLLGRAFGRLPRAFNRSLPAITATIVLAKYLGFGLPDPVYYVAATTLVATALLLGLSLGGGRLLAAVGILFSLLVLGAGAYWFWQEGSDPFARDLPRPVPPAGLRTLAEAGLGSPAAPGDFAVETFTYGSGSDRRRPEYAAGVRFTTPTVDAGRLLPEWKGKKKKWRERYWGFGVTDFPLNGRVYLPAGIGPFPLVLIVHGNHAMIDYSDGGYAYLGELLAGRGMIAVSVDENFINGHWSGDFRGREMPTRAWLLLRHLAQWREWNDTPDHELYGRVAMDRILLVGHSRGGEAVSIAAAFNRLPAFPDDALERFDFQFGIRGVVSIAPTDYRYHRQIELENLHYLSLQGSYDADEVSFWGLRPYRRLQFTDGGDWFKAGVYLHRANHGQFNGTWGRSDFGPPGGWLLNTQPLLSAEAQQQAAQVFISAFAEAALNDDRRYLPIFENTHRAGDWLPNNYYLTHYAVAGDRILQDFEEDLDPLTGADSIRIHAEHLRVWREENLSTRDGGSQQNNAVVLGWDYGEANSSDSLASYTLELPMPPTRNIDSASHLLLTLGRGDFSELKTDDQPEPSDSAAMAPLDFHIRLTDRNGATALLALSQVKAIAPPLYSQFMKLPGPSERVGEPWEVQLETFALPLADFRGWAFDVRQLSRIEILFDQSPRGVIVVDNIGLGRRNGSGL